MIDSRLDHPIVYTYVKITLSLQFNYIYQCQNQQYCQEQFSPTTEGKEGYRWPHSSFYQDASVSTYLNQTNLFVVQPHILRGNCMIAGDRVREKERRVDVTCALCWTRN